VELLQFLLIVEMPDRKDILLAKYTIKRNLPVNYINGDLNYCLSEFSYETYNVDFRSLYFCFVTYEGIIYNSFLHLVKSSLVGPKLRSQYSLKRTLNEIRKLKIKSLDNNRKYLIAFDAWSGNHYHWITEVLSRLFLLKKELNQYILILPENVYIKNTGRALLNLLDLIPRDIIYVKPTELIYSNKLHFINHVALTGYINDKVLKEIKKKLDSKIQHHKAQIYRKLYITRGQASYRKVLNETDVVSLLISEGYEIFDFGILSLEDQISICSQANIMISMHGAGLTNMIFMIPGSKILEFRRNKIYHNQCYWHLADALKHKYFYLFGDPDSDLQLEGNGCNLTIPLLKLRQLLDEMASS
jgi:hypothetical protein